MRCSCLVWMAWVAWLPGSGCTGATPGTGTETTTTPPEDLDPIALRVATYNVALYGAREGQIADRLADPDDPQALGIAAVLQDLRPDVVLLNEVDHDSAGLAAQRINDDFLAVARGSAEALDYPYVYVAPSNTGVHSGFDLDNDGVVASAPNSEAYGDDAFGFGTFPGQYSFVVLSRFPIGPVRSFRQLTWAAMPNNDVPEGWFTDEELEVVRLSSKNHVDLSIEVGSARVHLLVSHPTPPSFDGDEDRNGRRNHDEIRLWADYLDGGPDAYHVDDAGVSGALDGDELFVIAGDLNADPLDGDSRAGGIQQLLEHPLVQALPTPRGEGGAEQAALQGGVNALHLGDPAHDTVDFSDTTVGNLRLDYVLPSTGLEVTAAGVGWPTMDDPLFEHIGLFPFPVSDHRPVWVDLQVPQD